MSKERTLERIEFEIAAGDLGKARDRLHGLIRTYPDDISLRSLLASVYWKLQYPHMAGCYWYLEENQTDETRQAVASFEKRCGGDPRVIWRWLKLKGLQRRLPAYAKARFDHLVSECKRKHRHYPQVWGRETEWHKTKKGEIKDAAACVGCAVVVIVLTFIFVLGVTTIIGWFR